MSPDSSAILADRRLFITVDSSTPSRGHPWFKHPLFNEHSLWWFCCFNVIVVGFVRSR